MPPQIIRRLHLFPFPVIFKAKWRPDTFLWHRHRATLSANELEGISHLLEAGLPIPQAFQLALHQKHQAIGEKLQEAMQDGADLNSLFPSLCPGLWALYLQGLMPVLGFTEGLHLTRLFVSGRQKTLGELQRQILYPCTLLLSATAAAFLFTEIVCPSLLRMAIGFHADVKLLYASRNLLRLAAFGILLFFVSAVLLSALSAKRDFKIKLYQRFTKIFPDALPVLYWSASFICFFTESLRCGHSTKQALRVIASLNAHPVLAAMASSLHRDLEAGDDLVHAVHKCRMDPMLEKMLNIAIHTNEPVEMLDAYFAFSLQRIRARIRFHLKLLQLSAYALLGFMLVVVYRVLLMPLSVFETL